VNPDSVNSEVSLEDRLFKNAIYVGLFVLVLILIYDFFLTGDYISVIIECFGLIYFLINLRILIKRKSSARHRLIFSMVLFIIMNAAWMSGGGISILMASVLFLVVEFILVVNEARYYWTLVVVLILNYIIFFCSEYFFQFNFASDYEANKGDLIKQFIIVFLLIFFGGYFTVFLKLKYNAERSNLNGANKLLLVKTEEISSQNEKLLASKETLDKTITKLDNQKIKLIEIQGSLEDKVKERTDDLMKLNERLLAQNQQLEQYAYITSHNLRAPITQIKGLVHLLPLKGDFDEMTKETLIRLEDSAINLEKVFSDLSTILRVKNNLQNPLEEIDFVDEISIVIESLRSSIKKKAIKLIYPVDDTFLVKALKPYIHSIFHNIIENAIKYSDTNKKESFVKIELSETHKYAVASISDNGIGIDMSAASEKVFQMYQRFNNTHPGQGFGLFLVKSQMEAMGGKVELESILGQGTTFSLYFLKQ